MQTPEEKNPHFSAWGMKQPLGLQGLPVDLGCEETLTAAAPRQALGSSHTQWDAGTRRQVLLSASHSESAHIALAAPALGRVGAWTPAHQTPATSAGSRGFQGACAGCSCTCRVGTLRRCRCTPVLSLEKRWRWRSLETTKVGGPERAGPPVRLNIGCPQKTLER